MDVRSIAKATLLAALGGLCLSVPGPAAADGDSVVSIQLRVTGTDSDADSEELDEATRTKIADRAVERIQKRLEAARIKHATAQVDDAGRIGVEASPNVDRSTVLGIVVPPGEFALRPIERRGGAWQKRVAEIPAGIQLRQVEGSLASRDAYLWSENRDELHSFLEEHSPEDVEPFVYVHDGGWRSILLGDPAVTEDDLQSTELRSGTTGTAFVRLSLEDSGGQQLQRESDNHEGRWAVVVDDEIVAVLQRDPLADGAVNVSPPDHLGGKEARMRWARQIAGRLAAPIPVKLMPAERPD